jgi:formylmethanofuran dehydrogenase subunit E
LDDDSRENGRILLARAVEFHGHLGPFLILGIRMGVIARSMLKTPNHNDLTAIMFVNPKPPASCVVDGVQIASGCTLGKGTIRVSESANQVAGEFHAGNRICTVMVKPELLNWYLDGLRNATEKEVFEMAEAVLARPDEELFQITTVS